MDMPTIAHPSRSETARVTSDTAASTSPFAGFTPGDVAMVVMWAALAVIVLAYAISRGSIGAFVAGGLVAWQVTNAWSAVTRRRELGDEGALMRTL